MARQLRQRGLQVVDFEQPADVYVLNSCSVTENADRECRQWVRRLRRRQPQARIVISGCYAQLQPHRIAAMGVDLVLGMAEKFELADYLSRLLQNSDLPVVHCSDAERLTTVQAGFSLGERTRSFLKVQDGCNYHCSFCTIPLARGPSRSFSVQEVIRQALDLQRAGVQEVVLTGVNVGDFGIIQGRRQFRLLDLVQALERETRIPRFRISSIEPNLLTDELIDFIACSGRFMPHLHLPLQSGSDAVLSAMRRRYNAALYADRISTLHRKLPQACIGADVITGFPGETESDFEQTYTLLRDLPVHYLHVFTYSERPGTEAATMGAAVPQQVRKQRTLALRSLSERKRRQFFAAHEGSVRPVLFEQADDTDGSVTGYTDNYIPVTATGGLPGAIMPVLLQHAGAKGIRGIVAGSDVPADVLTAESTA